MGMEGRDISLHAHLIQPSKDAFTVSQYLSQKGDLKSCLPKEAEALYVPLLPNPEEGTYSPG